MAKKVYAYDTTLRDGEQSEGITLSLEDKLRIVARLDEFGVDYKKGDKVTVRDEQLNVVVSARITEVQEEFDDEYALVLTFGYSYPTIMKKVKQQIS